MSKSLYSLHVNRRHGAYTLAGLAVRLATVMGLHLSAEIHVQDPATREHRKRVWWTAYTFDRMFASKIGLPPSIADEEVFVELPASIDTAQPNDFLDHEYLIASVRLARLAGNIIFSIYRRNNANISFSKRVHSTLQQLHAWVEKLPSHLQLSADKGPPDAVGRAVSLHLSFNQVYAPEYSISCFDFILITQVPYSCNPTYTSLSTTISFEFCRRSRFR